MEKVSIIIPVYNGEKYINRCLDSIINQTQKNFEIIVIDDASTDKTKDIVMEYANKYNRETIKYIYKEKNTIGNGLARNIGINAATSKYVMFVDCDDYIDLNLLEKVNKYIDEDVDLIKYKLERVDTNGKLLSIVDGAVFDKCTGEEAFNKLYSNDVLIDSPCLYIYKKSLFIDNNLKFMDDVYHEDFGLIPLVLASANSVVSLNFIGYFYVQEDGSITRNVDYKKTLKKCSDVFLHYDNMISKLEKMKLQNMTKENIKRYYSNAIILKINELKKKDQKQYINEIKKRKMLKNLKARNIRQVLKNIILNFDISLYAKFKK